MEISVSEPIKRRERSKPVHVAKMGNVRVPVTRNGPGRFCVAWRQYAGAPRQRETFKLKKDAVERAEEIAQAIANSQADVLTLSSADRDSYRLAMAKLAPLGVPLHVAVEEYVAARGLIAPQSLMEAAETFAKDRLDRTVFPASAVIYSELAEQLQDPHRPASSKHTDRLAQDLEPFCSAYPRMEGVTEKQLREYLRGLKTKAGKPVAARTRDNVLGSILRLFRFARTRGYFPADKITPAEQIERVAIQGEVCTYSPELLQQLFAVIDEEWLPWLALAAFGGLRTSEIFRLRWEMIRWTQGVIAVPIRVARKVNRPRLVPLLPNLQLWLAKWRNSVGPIYEPEPTWDALEKRHGRGLRAAERKLATEKKVRGFRWSTNALRHSFGSYRLATIQNIEQLRLEMGNSPRQIQTYYNDPKTAEEAALYFAIAPEVMARNVVSMEAS